jgi:hypothetical protein
VDGAGNQIKWVVEWLQQCWMDLIRKIYIRNTYWSI